MAKKNKKGTAPLPETQTLEPAAAEGAPVVEKDSTKGTEAPPVNLDSPLDLTAAPVRHSQALRVTAPNTGDRFRVQGMSKGGHDQFLSGFATGMIEIPVTHGYTYDVRYQRVGHRARGKWQRLGNIEIPPRRGLTKAKE